MISAVVLTRNEEKNISRCLQSLSWCDEVIVIDDFSTDKTAVLAKKLGAKVFKRRLNNDFAAQRNFGLRRAQGDWVLFVDADEVVTSLLREEIREKTRKGNRKNTERAGFHLKRKDYFLGKWLRFGETAHLRLLRLAKKGAGEWQRPVHEIWQIKGEIGQLKNPLLHYHQINLSQFLERINDYTTINAKIFNQQGRRENFLTIILFPIAKFIQNYFLRLGFWDGFPGLVMAFLMGFHSLVTRIKIWELHHGKNS